MTSVVRANETRRLFNGFFCGAILGCMLRICGASEEKCRLGSVKTDGFHLILTEDSNRPIVGRMDPERVRRWSLRAAAFTDSDSAKKTPDRRNAAAI
ncbi:hypothetical protein T02_5893 [Trichinella nativa]|uniref:Uncharacterized protein n=1 Tax=Trichinella nativa TaxID=6335 RepID=A0A0V1KTQ8_9BILA|nr:hypothetical protein T02_5893 [Trichinella nativa]